jgi:orotate phosphoribosyltransferase
MGKQEVLEILEETKAVLANGHFVYKSGNHGRAYVNKDAVYPHPLKVCKICSEIIEILDDRTDIDVIAAPTIGGVILGNNVAYQLNMRKIDFFRPKMVKEILSVYAEEENGERVFKRGYDKLISGKNVVIIDDVATKGGTVKKMISAVQKLNGKVIAVFVLCNRGGLTEKDFGVPFFALVNISLEDWLEEECPLCKEGVPINTEVGKGKEYLAKKQAKAQ